MNYSSLFTVRALSSCFISFAVGFLFALSMPTLSVYVAQNLGARPLYVGLFFVLVSITSIVYAQLLGHWSDKEVDRRKLIAAGMFSGAIGCGLFSMTSSYWQALLVGLSFFSFAFACIAQIFAYARNFSELNLPVEQGVLFNSVIRACAALAWVSGPPIGFWSFNSLGFQLHYFVVAAAFAAVAISSLTLLVPLHTVKKPKVEVSDTVSHNRVLALAVVAFSILYGCNHSYLIALPLFLTNTLNVDLSSAGWLMGTAAALEIPIMLIGGWLASRFSLIGLMRLGSVAAVVLYLGIWQSQALWQLFVLQFFNALFIGFIAGLGVTWFQDMLPGRAGAASALYMNCTNIGNVLGAVAIMVFAEWLGYHGIFWINAIAAIVATVLLFFIRDSVKKTARS